MPKRNFRETFKPDATEDGSLSEDSDDSINEARLIHKRLKIYHHLTTIIDLNGPSTSRDITHSFYEIRVPEAIPSEDSFISSDPSTLSSYTISDEELPSAELRERQELGIDENPKQIGDTGNASSISDKEQTDARERVGKRKRKRNNRSTEEKMEIDESLINNFKKISLKRIKTLDNLHHSTDEETDSTSSSNTNSKKCKMSEGSRSPDNSDDMNLNTKLSLQPSK